MPPRALTGQGQLSFTFTPRSAATDTAGATVDEDEQNDKAILVVEQQKVIPT